MNPLDRKVMEADTAGEYARAVLFRATWGNERFRSHCPRFEDVAKAASLPTSTVWRQLTGRAALTFEVAAALAGALGVSPGDLFRPSPAAPVSKVKPPRGSGKSRK